MVVDGSVQAAIECELRLLEPQVRASADLVDGLLDPEFSEIGASGKRWDRRSIIAALAEDGAPHQPIEVSEMSGTLIAPGVVHLTFTTEIAGRRAHRSSLWRLTSGGWRMRFHQGTPASLE